MRAAHFTSELTGGTGIAAARLHAALQKQGALSLGRLNEDFHLQY